MVMESQTNAWRSQLASSNAKSAAIVMQLRTSTRSGRASSSRL